VRWILRAKGRRRVSAPTAGPPFDESKQFTFSVIDPATRRHPVIAWMSHHSIDILDVYSIPSPSTTSPSSPTGNTDHRRPYPDSLDIREQIVIETDHNLRTLIVVTGIWIAFREGWSQNSISSDVTPTVSTSLTNSPACRLSQSSSVVGNGGDELSPIDRRSRRTSLQLVGSRIRQTSSTVMRRSTSLTTGSKKQTTSSNNPDISDFVGADFIGVTNAWQAAVDTPGNSNGQPHIHTRPHQRELLEAPLELDYHRQSNLNPVDTSNPPRLVAEDLFIPSANPKRGVIAASTFPTDDIRGPVTAKSSRGKEKKWRRLGNWFDSVSKRSKGH
jgi:hypothetical protein